MRVRSKAQPRDKKVIFGLYDIEFHRDYNYEESKNFKINQHISEKKPAYFRWTYEDKELLSPAKYAVNSRYEKVPTMSEKGKSYHATNRLRGVPYDRGDQYYIVDNQTQNRLDKISLKYYGTPHYWWAIAHANNIFDAFNVPRGITLRIPTIAQITAKYFN